MSVPWFADGTDVSALLGSSVSPSAYYFEGNHRGVTLSWQKYDDGYNPYMSRWDRDTGKFATPTKLGTNPLGISDSHGCCSHIVDDLGYIHAGWGCHGVTQPDIYYAISQYPENTSLWVPQTALGYTEAATYPRWIKLSDGTLYIFFRGTNGDQHFQVSTDNGATWSISYEILNITDDPSDRTYVGKPIYDSVNNRIHLVWEIHDDSEITTNKRRNIYHAYYDLSDGHMYTMAGVDLGAIPINQTVMDASCKIVDSGAYATGIRTPHIHLDSSGYPYITYNIQTGATDWYTKFIYWTGAAWSAEETIQAAYAGDGGGWTVPDFIVHNSSNIEAYVLSATFVLEKWSWNGTIWTKDKTIMSDSCRCPTVVENYIDEFRCIFCTADYLYALNSDDEIVYEMPMKIEEALREILTA